MNSEFIIPNIPAPGEEYNKSQMLALIRTLTAMFEELRSAGQVNVNTLNIANLPTSSAGLRPGDVWNDGGTLKIV